MLDPGRYQAGYVLGRALDHFVITAGFTGCGVGGCMAISDGFRRGCCIAQNLAMGAVGFGLGYALGAAVTGAAAKVVVFVKMDVQANLIGTLVPPVCGS